MVFLCTPTALASAKTLVDAQSGQMTVRQFKRWANLLGLGNEEDQSLPQPVVTLDKEGVVGVAAPGGGDHARAGRRQEAHALGARLHLAAARRQGRQRPPPHVGAGGPSASLP